MSVSPPRPKGPPLNALRAFEAAARLGSFSAAAEELCVTPGAISQHIKAIEDWTGIPLFERRSQGVRLTSTGQRLKPAFTEAFDAMGEAVNRLRETIPKAPVEIAALPSIAQLWLSKRMPRLRTALPDLGISVTALERPPNLRREMFDLSLFLREPSRERNEVRLSPDTIFPICNPDIARRLTRPTDLRGETLLHDISWADDWQIWATSAGLDLPNIATGSRYSLYSLALEEAKNGAGVLMGHGCLVQDALADGSLVAPYAHQAKTGKYLILEHSGTKTGQQVARAFGEVL